jgi:hypothetical protein
MHFTVAKAIGILTLLSLLGTTVFTSFTWFQTVYADFVDTKIEVYETRVENTQDGTNDVSSRIQHYQSKEDDGIELPPRDKSRKRQLENQRDTLSKRLLKQEAQLVKWEDKQIEP